MSVVNAASIRAAVAGGLVAWSVGAATASERPVVACALAVATTAGLLVRPRAPVVVLAATLGGLVLLAEVGGFPGPDDPFVLAIAWAAYGVGRHASLIRQPWAAAATLTLLSMSVFDRDAGAFPARAVFPVLLVAAPWLIGLWIQLLDHRSRRAIEAARDALALRSTEVAHATAEERLRIAREVHDVAAHHLTVVALHTQVLGQRVTRGDAITGDDLATISSSVQLALAEVRRIVGVLRSDTDRDLLAPLPGLTDLPALVEDCRRAGQPAQLTVEGDARPVPPGPALALYRIAQEVLTNARRHGGRGATQLLVRWTDSAVVLVGSNPARRIERLVEGNGIRGIRERVSLYGGDARIGPDASGRWVVSATIPLSPEPLTETGPTWSPHHGIVGAADTSA